MTTRRPTPFGACLLAVSFGDYKRTAGGCGGFIVAAITNADPAGLHWSSSSYFTRLILNISLKLGFFFPSNSLEFTFFIHNMANNNCEFLKESVMQ